MIPSWMIRPPPYRTVRVPFRPRTVAGGSFPTTWSGSNLPVNPSATEALMRVEDRSAFARKPRGESPPLA